MGRYDFEKRWKVNLYRNTRPHRGFGILREWAMAKPGGYFVFTSNVDGHFAAAGFAADRIVECHGSIHHLQCAEPCDAAVWPVESVEVKVDIETMRAMDPLPRCPCCGGMARPNILMFGDGRWVSARTDATDAAFEDWQSNLPPGQLCVIECGAGTAIPTVRLESERMARKHGGKLIRINVRDPAVPRLQTSIPLPAMEAIERIFALL